MYTETLPQKLFRSHKTIIAVKFQIIKDFGNEMNIDSKITAQVSTWSAVMENLSVPFLYVYSLIVYYIVVG